MVNSTERKSFVARGVRVLEKFGIDTFILLLISMIVLAGIFPQGGVGRGKWSLSSIAGYGISLIFFFYGLKLNFPKLKTGLRNWKLHLVVHVSTFVLFPLLVLACRHVFKDSAAESFWLGAFFLASLPSTVSSSVVMVSIAEGNIPAAIFNASLSSILGVFITPVWMSVVLSETSGNVNMSDIILKLVLQILLPVILGILLNAKWGKWADRCKKELKYFDQTIILMIVYTAFCEAFAEHMFSNISIAALLLLGGCVLFLFFVVYGCINLICKLFSFNREDTITASFCGSKKSLVHGTVMSNVLFAGSSSAAILLLPLMLYHAMQLIIISMIAQKKAKDKHHAVTVSDPGGAVTV